MVNAFTPPPPAALGCAGDNSELDALIDLLQKLVNAEVAASARRATHCPQYAVWLVIVRRHLPG